MKKLDDHLVVTAFSFNADIVIIDGYTTSAIPSMLGYGTDGTYTEHSYYILNVKTQLLEPLELLRAKELYKEIHGRRNRLHFWSIIQYLFEQEQETQQ